MASAWVPLESNPEVMTKFLHNLGVPKQWAVVDVYGLEPEMLALIPKPVLSVILLYPYNQKMGSTEQEDEGAKDDETESSGAPSSDSVYHMKQYIRNACGTIALIHSVANNLEAIKLEDGFLKKFLDDSKNLSFSERGTLLVNAHTITDMHQESAQEGQTEAPSEDTPVFYHFVALVHHNGTLYELDGRKSAPINHGSTTPETLLDDAANVCRKYMSRDPEEVCFTVVALAAAGAAANE